jgi:hypothetical protein
MSAFKLHQQHISILLYLLVDTTQEFQGKLNGFGVWQTMSEPEREKERADDTQQQPKKYLSVELLNIVSCLQIFGVFARKISKLCA